MRRLSRSFYFCPCLPLNSLVTSIGYKIVRLANGVHSVHSLAHRETFHPVIGPVAEAEALYVKQLRLAERIRRQAGEFVIWDVGLGAAANALTVLRATRDLACSIRLVSFDNTVEPLAFALQNAKPLAYFSGYLHCAQHLVPHGRIAFDNGAQPVEWKVVLADFPSLLSGPGAAALPRPDAILFDPFSPAVATGFGHGSGHAGPELLAQSRGLAASGPLVARVFPAAAPNQPLRLKAVLSRQ